MYLKVFDSIERLGQRAGAIDLDHIIIGGVEEPERHPFQRSRVGAAPGDGNPGSDIHPVNSRPINVPCPEPAHRVAHDVDPFLVDRQVLHHVLDEVDRLVAGLLAPPTTPSAKRLITQGARMRHGFFL